MRGHKFRSSRQTFAEMQFVSKEVFVENGGGPGSFVLRTHAGYVFLVEEGENLE